MAEIDMSDAANSASRRQYAIEVRIVSAILAIGGLFFGTLVAQLLIAEPWQIVIWGPGYLITVGYFIRAASRPNYLLCAAIWWSSLVVQGAWLVIGGLFGGWPAIIWWLFATITSTWALFVDPCLHETDGKEIT
jgi:hypothetical protein